MKKLFNNPFAIFALIFIVIMGGGALIHSFIYDEVKLFNEVLTALVLAVPISFVIYKLRNTEDGMGVVEDKESTEEE